MNTINLASIEFGQTDANNELASVGPSFYLDSFLNSEKYRSERFIQGRSWFICGKKGTGKTAFLKYLECYFMQDCENLVIPLRFKSELDEYDKGRFAAYSVDPATTISDEKHSSGNSYLLTWQAFLIYQVIRHSREGEYRVFERNAEYDNLYKVLQMLFGEQLDSNTIMPKVKKGMFEIAASLKKTISSSLKLKLGFDDDSNKATFAKATKYVSEAFAKLTYGSTPVYVLVDELELSVANKKLFRRDVALVRDLIQAIERLNMISSSNGFDIHFIASIRSDVIDSVHSSGCEINKCIEDHGVTISWFQKGGNYKDNDLLKILERKIRASEKDHSCPPCDDVWETYFENPVHGLDVRRFILRNSWYRPRDVVRMMRLVQSECADGARFNQEMFDKAQQQYSINMWNEITEGLVLNYSEDDIRAIQKIFYCIPVPFYFSDVINRIQSYSEIYDYVARFSTKYKPAEFLETMFEWGIIGNSGERMVFHFMNDGELSLLDPMIIHKPLRNFFAVKSARDSHDDREW